MKRKLLCEASHNSRNDVVAKRKTAGYARVSTDSEEQLTSYEAQVDYYTNYIKSRPEWEFVNVYTDEGISATDTRHRTAENILSNEKYKGDARLQKCYTVDFLSKKRKANEGEVPQYYVEGSHNCCSPFSAKLKCGDCGEYFGSKVWHSNSKYKRTVWQCNAKRHEDLKKAAGRFRGLPDIMPAVFVYGNLRISHSPYS